MKPIFKEVVMINRDREEATAAALRRRGGNPGRWMARIAFFLLLIGALNGCTPQIYNVNMRYEPTKVIPPAVTDAKKYSITEAPLIDQRKLEDPLLIGKVITSSGTPVPILPRYVKPTEAVTAALREVLGKSGYAVTPVRTAWNFNEAEILPEWGAILLGGTIDTLDVTCTETFMKSRYNATVRVTLIFADVPKKKIFYRLVSESSSSLDHVFFSEERLESQINGVLSDAVEKAIEGPETARQIREALNKP
jgi:hypothetical protein